MADRKRKLKELDSFRRRLPFISASALEQTFKLIEAEGMPDVRHRNAMHDAREIITRSDTSHGKLVQWKPALKKDNSLTDILLCNPLAFIWHVFQNCKGFRVLLLEAHEKRPSTPEDPWHLILYSDEVTPGNVLAPLASRKSWAIYSSFKELGPLILSRENAWITCFVGRTSKVKELVSGIAQVFGILLKMLFDPDGTHLETTGLFLSFED